MLDTLTAAIRTRRRLAAAPAAAATATATAAGLALAIATTTACGSGGSSAAPDADTGGFDRRAMLGHLGGEILAPAYPAFAAQATALAAATAARCADPADPTGLLAAQDAWRAAATTWARIDVALVGPVAMDGNALRDRIYAWPLAATCGVDKEVIAHHADPAAYDVGVELNNVRSLAAVEYLLFVDDPAHTCPLPPSGWDALAEPLPAARCGLAAAIAADVAAQADALAGAWATDGGDYGAALAAAGESGPFPSEREAVNHVSDALFYVDRFVKDMKLAEAAGIALNACGVTGEPCLREVEHRHADAATAALRANLAAARELFVGGDGVGFDDYLGAVGAVELSTSMVAALDAAIVAADALPDSFLTALAEDRDAVVAAHAAVKAFTDLLKTQFLTTLGLDIPDSAAGDND